MDEQIIKNMVEIAESGSLKGLLVATLSEIRLSKKSFLQYFVSIVVSMMFSFCIIYSENIIDVMSFAVGILNDTVIAFIAIIFTTYSVFQALLTDSVVLALLKNKGNLLNISNKSFLHLILLYVFDIGINIILLILLKVMPEGFCLFSSLTLCNLVAFFLCFIYFMYNSLIIYEIKNFAVNLYRMFAVYNYYRSEEILKKLHK